MVGDYRTLRAIRNQITILRLFFMISVISCVVALPSENRLLERVFIIIKFQWHHKTLRKLLYEKTVLPPNGILSPSKSDKKLIHWTSRADNAFNKIKCKFSKAIMVTFFAPNAEIAISVDASVTGRGRVLQQKLKMIGNLCFSSFNHSPQLKLDMPHLIENYLQFILP